MLNYKELNKKFTEKLQQFDDVSIKKWVDFDTNRILLEKLLSGETVNLFPETISSSKLDDVRESISEGCDNKYALAA